MQRRSFLMTAATAGAARAQGDRIRGGIIGAGGRGRYLTEQFKEIGVEMAGVCDVYEANLNAGLKVASTGAKAYDNYKRLLDDKSIDVVVVATPDHWHAQMTIDAVEAGKDVYVEKPMAHTIEDGFRMIEATRRTKRIVQVGMQRRSYYIFQEAKQVMDSGQVGRVRLVNSWWLNTTPTALSQPTLQGKLDWNQWLGNTPKRPLDPVRFRNWYWFWDYSGGLLVGQAAHVLDAVNWLMNSTYPVAVTGAGKLDQAGAEVPETASITIEYPEYLCIFTLGYKAMRYALTNDQLKQFHGSKARFDVGRESYALYLEDPNALDLKATISKREPGSFGGAARAHIRNFLECHRTRKEPNAPVEAGQHTNVVLCMGMEAVRTGRKVRYNAAERRMES
jgi:predicted dehydrogenase